MDVDGLQDKLARGMGTASRKLGTLTTVYRPAGPSQPLSEHHRIIRMMALFVPKGPLSTSKGVVPWVWQGVFDASYTRQSDYLVSSSQTFFIGNQTPGLPVECVLTNRTISLSRSAFTRQGGYSGLTDDDTLEVLSGWPVSLSELAAGAATSAAGRQSFGTFTVLLPASVAIPRSSDVITDDLGATYIVSSTEQDALGWKLTVRQLGA